MRKPSSIVQAWLCAVLETAALAFMPVQAMAAADSPLAVVTSIYKQEISPAGTDWMSRANRPRRLTASLASLWTKAEKRTPKGDELLDFDLAADTNGYTLTGYEPKVEKQEAAAAVVAVTLQYDEKTAKAGLVRYTLVRENGAWKIDDIGTTSWSLRNMLGLAVKP